MNSSPKKFYKFIEKICNQRWLIAGITLVIGFAFILVGNLQSKPGFPLDDAWIHQTYAKNLAESGQWEFLPGVKSAGSTSPLWTMVISIGFLLGFKTPFLWTSVLSIGMLVGIALVSNEILQYFFKDKPIIGILGSLLVIVDWHLLWSSASGMETLFYCLASIYIFWLLISSRYWGWLGALCGLIVWIRPDGITMLGPVFLLIFIKAISRKFSIRDGIFFMIPLVGLLGLYGLFNYSISGSIFPNTFFAKQMEYASFLQQPILNRLGSIFLVPVSGAGIFLIPGTIYAIISAIKKSNWWLIAAILWFTGYGVLYALRLPMVYQHGRYLIPLIPVFYFIGIIGTVGLANQLSKSNRPIRKIQNLVIILIVFCSLIFAVSGELALITDIKTIDRLMVQPALWIRENTPQNTIIAVHDIGAMGFYSERKIIDLAGLIQPEIIPIIRDQQAIEDYLVQTGADYLIVFRDWYPKLKNIGLNVYEFELETATGSEVIEIRKLR